MRRNRALERCWRTWSINTLGAVVTNEQTHARDATQRNATRPGHFSPPRPIKLLHERGQQPRPISYRLYAPRRRSYRRLSSSLRTGGALPLHVVRTDEETGKKSGITMCRRCTLKRHRSRWTNSWTGSWRTPRLSPNHSTWRNRRRNGRRTTGSIGSRSREYEHDSRPDYVQR